jgi:hypothetical protein
MKYLNLQGWVGEDERRAGVCTGIRGKKLKETSDRSRRKDGGEGKEQDGDGGHERGQIGGDLYSESGRKVRTM